MDQTRERCFVRKQMRLEDVSYSDPNAVYFATLCARDKVSVFDDAALAKEAVNALLWRRDQGLWRLYAYCLMPDHLHVAISPAENVSISEQIALYKSFTTSRSWMLAHSGQLWQRSWYDHIARSDENLLAICDYIMCNPVRKSLVESVELWPYSGMIDPLPL